jgi:uncharacterized protein (TIGR02466 family)
MSLQVVSGVNQLSPPSCLRMELFPTPVFAWRWPEAERWKAEIVDAVRKRQRESAGIIRTNRNGWHSEIDLPAWPEPAIQALVRWVAGRAQETSLSWREGIEPAPFGPWRMNGWANINPPEGYNALHHHAQRNWHWSACYYLELGDISGPTDVGGALVFEEHGMGLDLAGAAGRRSRRFVPAEGQVVIFPSWLYHKVEPHRSGGERISIAFNLRNAALEKSRLWEQRPTWQWRTFPGLMRRIAAWRGLPDGGWNAVPPGTDVTP